MINKSPLFTTPLLITGGHYSKFWELFAVAFPQNSEPTKMLYGEDFLIVLEVSYTTPLIYIRDFWTINSCWKNHQHWNGLDITWLEGWFTGGLSSTTSLFGRINLTVAVRAPLVAIEMDAIGPAKNPSCNGFFSREEIHLIAVRWPIAVVVGILPNAGRIDHSTPLNSYVSSPFFLNRMSWVVRKTRDCLHAMVDWLSMLVVLNSKNLQWKGITTDEFA